MRARASVIVLPFIFTAACASPKPGSNVPVPSETVVLLHGMGRSPHTMAQLGSRLRDAGYAVQYFDYETHEESLTEIAARLHVFVDSVVDTPDYFFVGHSLGNIIVREASRTPFKKGLRGMVMLAPPNHPQELARRFRDNSLYQRFTGDAGDKLASEEYYAGLPVPGFPFGVIAGTDGQTMTFDDANDRIVRVDATKLPGMADFVALPHNHTHIMDGKDTLAHILKFFRTGRFGAGPTTRPSPIEASSMPKL